MKPINEMTLGEIQESLKFLGDNNNNIPFEVIQKACYDYASRIHDLTRWIPVEELLPTEKDANDIGYVLWWRTDSIHLPDAGQWDLHTAYGYDPSIAYYTHWRRIDKPEGV